MILGIDTSTYFEEIDAGAQYFNADHELVDPLDDFIRNGVNFQRIRLWVNPYSDKNGKPYLGGTCDIVNFIKLAKLCLSKGYQIILDFHYSDFWCDPGKQFKPKAWQHLSKEALNDMVFEYTRDVLSEIKSENIPLYGIQIGNEITNGMLWPTGELIDNGKGEKRGNYSGLIPLIKSGIKASKEIFPKAKIILHLERSSDNKMYHEFFDEMTINNVDFDIIGASYYPYYHGKIDDVIANLVDMKMTYRKEVMFMELGYGFTTIDYISNYEKNEKQLVLNDEFVKDPSHYVPYPLTEDGQYNFLKEFLKKCRDNNIDGVFYWEPLWIPGKDICWTSREGQEYIKETGKSTRNEWANQALYDYKGIALKALSIYKNN
jgi:arabinogalactan endo-1,4-beta-galactosidase